MAYVVNEPLSGQTAGNYGFSVDPQATATALRRLADDLQSGAVILQRAAQFRVAQHDEFEASGVVLHFVSATEAHRKEIKKRVSLYGSGHQFPVDEAAVDHGG